MKKEIGFDRKKLIVEMSKLPAMVLDTAYRYALNYVEYGEDVTQKWLTSIAKTRALETARVRGYYEGVRDASNRSWIKTSDQLPKQHEFVLVSLEDGCIEIAEYCGGYWMVSGEYYYEISDIPAWQPLVEPYKEGEEQ